jgi:hypothetical protein
MFIPEVPMKRHTTRVLTIALLVIAVAMSSAEEKRFERTFSVKPGGTLFVTTDVGAVKVTGSSSNEVVVVADIRGSRREVKDLEITATQTGDGVEVKGKNRRDGWFFNWSRDLEVEFTIKVPREYNVEVKTSGGGIAVNNIKGTVQGKTSGGGISLADIDGMTAVATSGGGIKSERTTGELRLSTSGGGIEVRSASGDLVARTSGGPVRIADVDGMVRAETSGGGISIRTRPTFNKDIYAATSGGGIDIYLPRTVAATVDASTSGGSVSCDLPVTMTGKLNDNRINGSINGGGALVKARTSGGSVRIKALE